MRLRPLLVALVLAGLTRGARAQSSPTGRFELAPSYDGDTRVHLTVSDSDDWRRGSSSFDLATSLLQGFDAARFGREGEPVRFRLVRDAGALEFTGRVVDRRVVGRYAFTPDARFVDVLRT